MSCVACSCEYDATLGTVEMSINGTSLGVCFTNVHGDVYPAVCFYSGEQLPAACCTYSIHPRFSVLLDWLMRARGHGTLAV